LITHKRVGDPEASTTPLASQSPGRSVGGPVN
jgi:hypothetical protein